MKTRPSPSLAVSFVALCFAMAGTGYAAADFAKGQLPTGAGATGMRGPTGPKGDKGETGPSNGYYNFRSFLDKDYGVRKGTTAYSNENEHTGMILEAVPPGDYLVTGKIIVTKQPSGGLDLATVGCTLIAEGSVENFDVAETTLPRNGPSRSPSARSPRSRWGR